MAQLGAPGRRDAKRDAGKRRNASGAPSCATEGRVHFAAGSVAARLTWGHDGAARS